VETYSTLHNEFIVRYLHSWEAKVEKSIFLDEEDEEEEEEESEEI
jgi:hypothetical protein